jgi:hypothetical protein
VASTLPFAAMPAQIILHGFCTPASFRHRDTHLCARLTSYTCAELGGRFWPQACAFYVARVVSAACTAVHRVFAFSLEQPCDTSHSSSAFTSAQRECAAFIARIAFVVAECARWQWTGLAHVTVAKDSYCSGSTSL